MKRLIKFSILSILLTPVSGLADSVDLLADSHLAQFANQGSIQALHHRGMHFEVMKLARAQGDSGLSLSEQLAVARSAWALGLAKEAKGYWRLALANKELTGSERYRAMLSSAILELQEKNYDAAREIAERATIEIESSDVRAQFWLVIADSLKAQKALGAAEQYYQRAVDESNKEKKAEARYLLAECQNNLGKTKEARSNFVLIETNSVYSTLALNRLTEIDLKSQNYKGVVTWIEEGRKRASTEFKGPWQSYAYIEALLGNGEIQKAQDEVDQFKARVSQDNSWLLLASATLEGHLAEEIFAKRAMLKRESTQEVHGE